MIDFSIFKRPNPHPQKYYSYGVLHGTYCGELFVYIRTIGNIHQFISIPKLINRDVPIDKFQLGIDNNIVEVAEKIPKKIWNILKKQWEYNIINTPPPSPEEPEMLDFDSDND